MTYQWTGQNKVLLRFNKRCQAVGLSFSKLNSVKDTLVRCANILLPNKSDMQLYEVIHH